LILNTDAEEFGGSGAKLTKTIKAAEDPINEQPYSAVITLPPLCTLWFEVPNLKRKLVK
jgi:1,4-alpha-glucan branching enzyme